MVQIPENTVTQKDLEEWYVLQDQLKDIKNKEMLLRRKIFEFYFQKPEEGTNKFELADGFLLKGKYTLNRTIDEGALQSSLEMLRENKINPDTLVVYKPSLDLRNYRRLTAEQQKLFDQVLIVKPGSPSIEIVKPKKG